MKYSSFFAFIVLVFEFSNTSSQNLIAVQNGDTPEYFTNLDSAISHSESGDTLFLPGGNYSSAIYIDKELHIIGAGYSTEADTSNATGMTLIYRITYISGADNSSLTGVKISDEIVVGNDAATSNVSNILIKRCHIVLGVQFLGSEANNFIFIENKIGSHSTGSSSLSIDFFSSINHLLLNNVIQAKVNNANYCEFKNNIFLYASCCYGSALGTSYCIFSNNIFMGYSGGTTPLGGGADVFYNNLFAGYSTTSTTNIYYSNFSALITEVFVDYTYGLENDFHLLPDCIGVNAGTDGTDLGIYGGAFPWKDGGLPNNPHIYYKNIGSATNEDGNLDVNIKVSAQDN
ncbi:MAG: hypothetical protein WAT52_05995 [Chitinophagales bacterium]